MRSPVRSRALLSSLGLLCLALWGSPPAQAQDSGNPAVIVNHDILNNLEWAAAAGAQARAGGKTALLPSPESAPRSRVLVKPLGPSDAALPPPSRKPEVASELAATDTQEEDTGSGFAIASEPAAEEPVAAIPLPEPPAPAETSLATVPQPPEPPPAPQITPPAPESVAEPPQAPAAVQDAPDGDTPSSATATQTAMVLPPKLTGGAFRLLFEAGATALSETSKGKLTVLAEQLRADPKRRIQVQAFAGSEASARDARRLSLSRAVAVRSFLIEQGLSAKQVDVRALGGDSGDGPPDRVDVLDARE